MTPQFKMSPDPNVLQQKAANPLSNVWVAASAGSGKTKVLTDRVLSLLVSGARPEGLLCITYTKAAASEMSNRIHDSLSDWTQLSEKALSEKIQRLDGGQVTPEKMRRARELFARVLEVPGGLRIRTIHSFCQSVLGRFPLEARIAPSFEAMDERQASEAMELARDTIFRAAEQDPDGHLAAALKTVTGRCEENAFGDLMSALDSRRSWLIDSLRRFGGAEALSLKICEVLGAEIGVSEDQIMADFCQHSTVDDDLLRQAADTMVSIGKKTDKDAGAVILNWLASRGAERFDLYPSYIKVFLTDKHEARKKLCTKDIAEANPAFSEVLFKEQERIQDLDQAIRKHATASASMGLVRLGSAILNAYEEIKRATARLDYDDLIHLTAGLLTKDSVPWVLFKLDGGLDHILIDEAQDTSADQRAIIDALVDGFFEAGGAHGLRRTVFVVGDAKQSIYSFQGADPEGYQEWRKSLEVSAFNHGHQVETVPMSVSFRSVQAVLDGVDATFTLGSSSEGIGDEGIPLKHHAFRVGQPGQVELWTPTEPPEKQEVDLFIPPDSAQDLEVDATQALAEGLATCVKGWIGQDFLPSKGRTIQAGDILFLVQNRTAFIDVLVRELKLRDIPVAGVDRLTLTEQIAVMDLLALAKACLLPEDDLTFAEVLKSPFVGFDDDDLIRIAASRPRGQSLWRSLRLEAEHGDARLLKAADWFRDLLLVTDRLSPYEFFQNVLVQKCPGPGRGASDDHFYTGRQALIARLGEEIEDPLEEFLSLTLEHDRTNTPSLEGFIAWFGKGNTELKRDLDTESGGQVRIMTVHGAKGLQAPIVILPDALAKGGARDTPLRWFETNEGVKLPIWTPSSRYEEEVAFGLKDQQKAAREREYRRLLYVAMTRAEDRLIVTGRLKRRKPEDGNWWGLVNDGLDRLEHVEEEDFTFGETWSGQKRIYATGSLGVAPIEKADDKPALALDAAPVWLFSAPPDEPTPPRPLTPSRPHLADPPVKSPLRSGDPLRFKRGNLVHRMLQTLPEISVPEREQAARRYLALPGHELDAEDQEALYHEVMAVLTQPDFVDIFGPGSRAEVPIAGLIDPSGESGRQNTVLGQVDRLLISENKILVIDYKTMRPSPENEGGVPAAYIAQMAGYRAVLQKIYPDRPIQCGLIFTETVRLISLSEKVLEAYT